MWFKKNRRQESVSKGLTSGLVAGLMGTLAMSQFQTVVNAIVEKRGNASRKDHQGDQKSASATTGDEPATIKAATAIAENVFHHDLTKREEEIFGQALHYATGAGSGAIYGAVAEYFPQASMATGVAFGTAVWLIADELLIPALGLAKSPTRYPLSTHVYSLSAHLVFGLSTEAARRKFRQML